MTIDPNTRRQALIRAKARQFAQSVRECPGMAFRVPDAIAEWLQDDEFPAFYEACREFRIVQRPDKAWESRIA